MQDLIIIGGGPCGLAVAIEAAQAGLDYVVLEKGAITESIRRYPRNMTFYSTSDNIGIGGIPFPTVGPKASRSEALEYYRKVSEYFGLEKRLYTEVAAVRREQGHFEVETAEGQVMTCRKVVLATGYFDCPRMLNIPGEELPHVTHYYDEAHPYAHSKVLVIGGGNSAVDAALDLFRHGAEVALVHRRPEMKPSLKYWLYPDLMNRVKEGNIRLLLNSEVAEIQPGKVLLRDKQAEMEDWLDADFVLALIGYLPNETLLREAGVQLDPENLTPVYNPETFESNVPGLFLAGTITAGTRTEKVFIENGRLHAKPLIEKLKLDLRSVTSP